VADIDLRDSSALSYDGWVVPEEICRLSYSAPLLNSSIRRQNKA
jgi:hypothetical protein